MRQRSTTISNLLGRAPRRVAVLVVLLLAMAPAGAQAFSKAIWGDVYRNGVSQFPLYHKLGVKIFEADLFWNEVAPTRPRHPANPNDPAYRWPAEIDQAIQQARRFHMRVLLEIVYSPKWANGGHAFNWAPRPRDYATFAAAASRRYPSVHLWQVWGEPDRIPQFLPETAAKPSARHLTRAQKVAPHNYARVLDAAYGALKRVSRRNTVIGGSTYTTGAIDTQQWIENMRLPNGRRPRMDMYAHNPFGWKVPNTVWGRHPSAEGQVMFPDLGRLAGWVDKYLRRGLPLFLSEYTIGTAEDNEFNFWVSPRTQARWITDALRVSRRWKRIYALGWSFVYDDPPATNAGLIYANGKRKPGFYAFEHG